MIYQINYPEDAGTKFEMFRYPAGEVQVRFNQTQIDEMNSPPKTVHVVATIKDGEIMGLAMLMDALDAVANGGISLIFPYLPYSRADRRFSKGDCHGLFTFADFLNKMYKKRVVTLDAHSSSGDTFIRDFVNVSPAPIIRSVTESMDKLYPSSWEVLLPDAGAARYGIGHLTCTKDRDKLTGKLLGFSVPSKGAFKEAKAALIVDDICDGGGTFLGIADSLSGYNLDLYLYVTHGIFSKGFEELDKRFKHIYTTDSFKPAPRNNLTIIPAGGTIRAAIETQSELYASAK